MTDKLTNFVITGEMEFFNEVKLFISLLEQAKRLNEEVEFNSASLNITITPPIEKKL